MSVVKAVFKRNLVSFFGNPAGYVFIILFVGLTAWFAFVTEGFFAANQATLGFLTGRMPVLLMIFVSAVTMSTWAEERKLGTDELLFTLPSGDFPVVLGKFLANLAIFTAALFFTLSHVAILMYLGDPDLGLICATYLGYWLMGAAFIATGMFASSLTSNVTVGFILGALFCAVFAFAQDLALFFPGRVGTGINSLAAVTHMFSFGRGVVALEDMVYFLSIVIGMLYLNSFMLSRRHWAGGRVSVSQNPWFHMTLRVLAVAVILVSVNVLVTRFGPRMDATEDRLYSLSEETQQILEDLDSDKPVYIEAWISEEVPPHYVPKRDRLLTLLKEYDKLGGDALQVKISHPERFSQEARDAKNKYNIQPMPMYAQEQGEATTTEIFLSAAFICGVEEEIIPFFFPGIPVEYELTRTIRVVSKGDRPKVGVVDNELKLFGGFDFATRSRNYPWQIVQELQKQYNVENIRADNPIPNDVDVVISVLPSLMKDNELDHLIESIRQGKPTLLVMDPLPATQLEYSPRLPRPSPNSGNPFAGQQQPGEPKGDISRLLNLLGVRMSQESIVWDTKNYHPQGNLLPPEYVFITAADEKGGVETGFNEEDLITAGLQDLVAFYPGTISKGMNMEASLTFEPLLRTKKETSGIIPWSSCVTQNMFGQQQLTPADMLKRTPHRYTPQDYILAVRIRGELPVEEPEPESAPDGEESAEEGGDEEKDSAELAKKARSRKIDVILTTDMDMLSDMMFQSRMQGRGGNPDNVTFVLNCVDALSGDDSYITLRKRRPKARVLTRIEELIEEHEIIKQEQTNQAEDEADKELAEAQDSFNTKMKAVENRTDLDMRTKNIMMGTVKQTEQRRLAARKDKIEEDKNKKIEESRFAMEQKKREIRVGKKYMAVILPILLPLLIGIWVFLRRLSRENLGAARTRLVRD